MAAPGVSKDANRALPAGGANLDVRGNRLYLGGSAAEELAERFGTPLYVYEEQVIRDRCREFHAAFKAVRPEVHYALKANFNPFLLRILREEGMGIDAVSPHEVRLALEQGFAPRQILFTGNNTTREDLQYALEQGVPVNVGSLDELEQVGQLKRGTEVSVRLNPTVGAGHHQHVITGGPDSKFGIYPTEHAQVSAVLAKHGLRLTGIHAHIGSGILRADEMLQAMDLVLSTARQWAGAGNGGAQGALQFIDFGGGFGIPYRPEQRALPLAELGSAMAEKFLEFTRTLGRPLTMKLEPGRFLVAQAGTLLARVTTLKSTPAHVFVGTDSGFSHLIRPVLYGAYHAIINASAVAGAAQSVVVAGNICESGDVFTQGAGGLEDRSLSAPRVGHVLAMRDVGAYGMALSSQYNLRPRPPEVLVHEGRPTLIRRRETYEDLTADFRGL